MDPSFLTLYTLGRLGSYMLHFIREAQLSRALENYPEPELIPEKNIRKLQAMGKPALLKLLATESL